MTQIAIFALTLIVAGIVGYFSASQATESRLSKLETKLEAKASAEQVARLDEKVTSLVREIRRDRRHRRDLDDDEDGA